jgi:hypothetical protein
LIERGLLAIEMDSPKYVRVRPTRDLVALIWREIEASPRAFPTTSYAWLRGEVERLLGDG